MSLDAAAIEKKVIAVLADKASMDVGDVTLDASLTDELGLDSLNAVEIVFEFEEFYGVDVPSDKIGQFKTGRDILQYLLETLFPHG